jgi:muramoyltetrapeptide carboxypeptidase
VGTRWFPPLDGAILFIEDVGEKPYRLDRLLTQLRLAGLLDRVAGVAVGQLAGCDDDGVSGLEVVREAVRDLGVPAAAGFEAGHEDRNFALPLGPRATLIAPGPGDGGVARLLFDEGATS